MQVWYTATASLEGKSGVITNSLRSNAGASQDKLFIEAVHILGVPKSADGTVLESARRVAVRLNGRTMDSNYDASHGVIKLTGLRVPVAEPLQLRWRA
jgi:hypothetical protein